MWVEQKRLSRVWLSTDTTRNKRKDCLFLRAPKPVNISSNTGMNLASQCQRNNMKSFSVARTPTLDRDLRIRRFHSEDTHRVHNLFLEETRCMLWPMFVQAVRSPPAVVLHVMLMFAGVIFARSCILALFGGIFAFSGVFVYVYHWFYNYLTSSLRGDLSNITQVPGIFLWLNESQYLLKFNSCFTRKGCKPRP